MSTTVEVLTQPELDALLKLGRRDIAELQQLGYNILGGFRYEWSAGRGKDVRMISSDRDRWANLTPTPVVTWYSIASISSDGHVVRSFSSSSGYQPPWVLCNEVLGATPSQLDNAHSGALELVRDVFQPDRIEEGWTIEDTAKNVLAGLRSFEPFRSKVDFSMPGILNKDARSARRIEHWLDTEPPQQNGPDSGT